MNGVKCPVADSIELRRPLPSEGRQIVGHSDGNVTPPIIAAVILPGTERRDERGNVAGITPPQPCPELLTEEEAIRYLRLDIDGPSKPVLTLRYYREKGLLRATRVGRKLRYRRVELDRLLQNLTR